MGQKVSLDIDGGKMMAYLSLPESGRGPGLLVLPEIWSVNFHIKAATDYFAALGYVALAPALFWRLDSSGGEDTVNVYDDNGEEQAVANYFRFDEGLGLKDLAVVSRLLRDRPECTGKLGAVGYCFGGRMAFLTGVHNGIDAAASLYPTFIERCLDLAPRATFPWSVHLPEVDPLESPEAQTNILAAFKGHKSVEIHRYPGAEHGFDSDHATAKHYSRWPSQLANSRIALFLDRHLGAES
ncbi:MAG TPA: dienelactone hydrolase family protein [Magnetospirillaceae bacterium]